MLRLLSILLLFLTGCLYKAGSGLTAGVMDELAAKGQSGGVEEVGDRLLERQLMAELGHQLGAGVTSGVTEITPEQQANLEALVDGVLYVAATRTGTGLREEVSPELRAMVQRDIVEAFSEGLRGELGDSAEEVVDRLVTRAMDSMKEGIADPELRVILSEVLRDSIYMAMREGRPGSASVGETLEMTLAQNLLRPLEDSTESITMSVAQQVEEQAKATEATLRAVIGALVLILVVVVLLYFVSRRQLLKERKVSLETQADLRGLGAAIEVLDERTRAEIHGKIEEYRSVAVRPRSPGEVEAMASMYERKPRPRPTEADQDDRSDDYTRRS